MFTSTVRCDMYCAFVCFKLHNRTRNHVVLFTHHTACLVNGKLKESLQAFIMLWSLLLLAEQTNMSTLVFMFLHHSNSNWTVLHRNSSEWSDVWMRGDKNSERLQKHLLNEQLAIKMLKSSDEGTYKVLDQNGLAVSTVQLSVEGERPINLSAHLKLSDIWLFKSFIQLTKKA